MVCFYVTSFLQFSIFSNERFEDLLILITDYRVDYCYDQLITVDDCNVVVSAIIYSMWDFFLLIIFLGVRLF